MPGLSSMLPFAAPLAKPAQYILRVDDLCPTMGVECWRPLAELIEEFHLRPILAIIPDNRDEAFCRAQPDPDFWQRMRALEAAGTTIALHGYRHACKSEVRGLMPLANTSEFAGVAAATQSAWIGAGLRILHEQGLNPRLWAAPRHGFDRNTLQALRDHGIGAISDGLARLPFLRDHVVWVPQQLWAPLEKPSGLWTICVHPATATRTELERLRVFVSTHARQFTSVDRVLAEQAAARLPLAERAYAALALARIRLRHGHPRFRSRKA